MVPSAADCCEDLAPCWGGSLVGFTSPTDWCPGRIECTCQIASTADMRKRRRHIGDRGRSQGSFPRSLVRGWGRGGYEREPLFAGNVVGSDHVVSTDTLVVGSQPVDTDDSLPRKGICGSGRTDTGSEFVERLAILWITIGRRVSDRLHGPVIRDLKVPLRDGLPCFHGYREVRTHRS